MGKKLLKNIMVINDSKIEKIILQWEDNSGFGEITLSRKFDTLDSWVAKSNKDISSEDITHLLCQFSLGVEILR